jgi:hypothetical protein
VVERALVAPPESRIGPLDAAERQEVLSRSPYKGRYDQPLDRESAAELLSAKARQKLVDGAGQNASAKSKPGQQQSIFEAMAKSAARSIGSSLGRQIIRGILGSLSKR